VTHSVSQCPSARVHVVIWQCSCSVWVAGAFNSTRLPKMYVYSSVRSSTWDVDSLVTQLNEMASQGWDVVNVVNTGSDLAAILRRSMTATNASVVEAVAAAPAAAPNDGAGYGSNSSISPSPSSTGGYVGAAVTAAVPTVSAAPSPAAAPTVTPPVAAATPAPASTTPAGWYPDPSGRFEMRYWDGNAWTEHVARQGQQYTDPPVA
jgi:hypothetical protein